MASSSLQGDGSLTMQNLQGTSGKDCSCGGWLDHWKKFANFSSTPQCQVDGCNSDAEVGAHVILPMMREEGLRSLHFIVPMCKSHNGQLGQRLKSKPDVVFISANKSLTCGS